MTDVLFPRLFDFDKPPVLMIGSGISKRYLSSFKNWDELLQAVAERIGIDKRTYIAHKHIAEDNSGQFGVLPELALNLRQLFIEKLISKEISAEEIFKENEELSLYDKGVDPLKILVASEVSSYSVQDCEEVRKEIEYFRDLINIVPAVITTNYDCFLENEIFKEFTVYSSVTDYYYYNSEGIGEIYKIHGSVSNPQTMVITSKDYEEYSEKSKIITAKILSILCDYPLLIIGYSLSDNDVTRVIHDLMCSLDEASLKILRSNIVYIVYDESATEPVFGTKTFKNNEGEFTLRTICIKDFSIIYRELMSYTPSTSPTEIRRIRQLVKNIVLTAEPTEKQYMKIGIDSLDSENSDRITLIISDKEVSRVLKDYTPITPELLVDDFLSDNLSLNPDSVLRYFSVYSNLQPNMYIPLYPYIRASSQKPDRYSKKLIDFINRKKEQLNNQINKAKLVFENSEISSNDMFKGIKDYNKPALITYLLDADRISVSEAKELLRQLRSLYGKGNPNFDTNYKCAVTLAS